MFKLSIKKNKVYKCDLRGDLRKIVQSNDILDNVLDFFFDEKSKYVFYYRHETKKTNFIQRVNSLWFIPLYIITVPIQFLIRGRIGIDRYSRFGVLIVFLLGDFE